MSSRIVCQVIGEAGSGRSVLAAAVADLLAYASGQPVALMKVSEPYRGTDLAMSSGLATGRVEKSSDPLVAFQIGRRSSGATVVGLTSSDPALSIRPGGFFGRHRVPDHKQWDVAAGEPMMTVVDMGWHPLDGVAHEGDPIRNWLLATDAAVYPFVTASPSVPGLLAAEQICVGLRQLREWQSDVPEHVGLGPTTLAVSRVRKNTQGEIQSVMAGNEMPELAELMSINRVTYVPEDPDVVTWGVRESMPRSIDAAAKSILYASGAVNPPGEKAA